MKLKQRFFDKTVFFKDITRFAPVWVLYLLGIAAILLMLITNQLSLNFNPLYSALSSLNQVIGIGSLINLFYAMVVAQLLFGDLFNARLCNALHAMPPRRECWFTTHTVAGLLFCLVPNVLTSLALMPLLEQFWYTSLLWLLGSSLSYLLFFGLSVLSMQLTGNRFASIVVYGLINFLILLVIWYLDSMYVPLLYGLRPDYDKLYIFSPAIQLCTEPDYFSIFHPEACPCNTAGPYWEYDGLKHTLQWGGLGSSWGYMAICGGIGAVCLVGALLLYRIRRLETAGDFMAYKPMYPVFWTVFSLGCGGVCQLFCTLFFAGSYTLCHVFLLLGLVCGYFVAQMLLQRNIKIFNRKRFIHLGIFLAAFVLSFGLTNLDPIGITRYVPKAEEVEKVSITSGYYINPNSSMYDYGEYWYSSRNTVVSDDPEVIRRLAQGHKLLIRDGEGKYSDSSFAIYYQLKNGTIVTRYYTPPAGSPGCKVMWELLNKPQNILGFESLDAMQAAVRYLDFYGFNAQGQLRIRGSYKDWLLESIWADAVAGNLLQDSSYHEAMHANCYTTGKYDIDICFYDDDGHENSISLTPYECCTNTLSWLDKYMDIATSYFASSSPVVFAGLLKNIYIGHSSFEAESANVQAMLPAFAEALYQDVVAGHVRIGSSTTELTLRFDLGHTVQTVYIHDPQNSECYPYIEKLLNG